MKSKVYAEVLKLQLEKSLELLSSQFEVRFWVEEKDNIEVNGKLVYGLQLFQQTQKGERRLWFRQYTKPSNDTRAIALSELFDVIIGTFLVNASRTDDKTLEDLSKTKTN